MSNSSSNRSQKDLRVPEDADRDFVAGAFIIKDSKVLFLKHKKYGIWLQPGGHVEPGETPDEAAVRETLEETGLEVELIDNDEEEFEGFSAVDLPMPFNINLHEIEEGHWHCDFQYIVRIVGENSDYEYKDEDMEWLSKKELESGVYEMPENIRRSAVKAIEEVEE
jgi:8-oxo-dGTP pyrophosphatase MutT (NUDIX family)